MGRDPFTVSSSAVAMAFAIVLNLAIASSSFFLASIVQMLHLFQGTSVESARLMQASREAVVFSCLPIAAILIVRNISVTPVQPAASDPIYEDVTSTLQVLVAMVLAAMTIANAGLRLTGIVGTADNAGALVATAFYSLSTIYIILFSDARKKSNLLSAANWIVLISIVATCIIFVKRDFLLTAIPLLVAGRTRVRPGWIVVVVIAAALIIFLNMAVRGAIDLTSILTRVGGNQFKYLERYSLHFGLYDHCYGLATIWSFINPERYKAFYDLIFDPITLVTGGSAFRWDSSNLQERLNYSYCSVNIANFIYFAFVFMLLLFNKKLGDVRFYNVAFLVVIFAFEGFNLYNIPQALALSLLFLSGFWRIGRDMLSRRHLVVHP
jgi:hypothetical protein